MDKKLKKRFSIIAFALGVVALGVGVALFVIKSTATPNMADAEFLVSVGKWAREDTNNVVWNFVEIGKGALTTDNFVNSYDFIWSIEDDKLKIETDWFYDLGNEFEYKVDQKAKTLTVKPVEKSTEIVFKAL